MGVSKNRGAPKWMVKIMDKPIEMDDFGGKPLSSETSIDRVYILQPTIANNLIQPLHLSSIFPGGTHEAIYLGELETSSPVGQRWFQGLGITTK